MSSPLPSFLPLNDFFDHKFRSNKDARFGRLFYLFGDPRALGYYFNIFSGNFMSHSSSSDKYFDYLQAVKDLCGNLCLSLRVFRSIKIDEVGFALAHAQNKDSRFGRWASMTPLRFEDGALATRVTRPVKARLQGKVIAVGTSERYYKTPRVLSRDGKTELKYILTIVQPRFHNLSVEEKIDTLIHELYHISADFNGDVRRFPGRNWQHGSKARYNLICQSLRKEWLQSDPEPRYYEFLQWRFNELLERFGGIRGYTYPQIKLVEISREEAIRLNPKLRQ